MVQVKAVSINIDNPALAMGWARPVSVVWPHHRFGAVNGARMLAATECILPVCVKISWQLRIVLFEADSVTPA